ncbi:DUF3159 domain-containing protein [Pilimelia columellifera]|uniref:DUF3159 domain-containing protein n=1 Tax=Pilimelia columellifera subsp. columellifera TaxID=706583 RepID=A0ABN3N6Q9_9ACTN
MTSTSRPATEPPLPSLSEQMAEQLGGWKGLLESSIPVVVFVVLNVVTKSVFDMQGRSGLTVAIVASVAAALTIAGYRLTQRRSIRHAMNGLFGVGIGAVLAWRSGEARDFYLPGIYYGYAYAAVLLGSAVVRKPMVGWVWSVLVNGGRKDWLYDARLLRAFQWLTVLWGVVWVAKVAVQHAFYLADMETALGVSRLALGYPPYLMLLAVTVWTVRRVRRDPATAPAG